MIRVSDKDLEMLSERHTLSFDYCEAMAKECIASRKALKELKLIGTDGCNKCDTGRVSMYVVHSGNCIECYNKELK